MLTSRWVIEFLFFYLILTLIKYYACTTKALCKPNLYSLRVPCHFAWAGIVSYVKLSRVLDVDR